MRPCAGRASAGPGLWSGASLNCWPGWLPPSGAGQAHACGLGEAGSRSGASPAVIFLQGDAACPPLADNSVDGVLSECVLSLLPDPLDALRGCRRTLRPGGALLLSDLFRHGDMLEEEGASLAPPESGCLAGARSRAVWEGLLGPGRFLYRVILRTTAGRWSNWRHGCSGTEPTPRPNGCAAAAPAAVGAGLSATACG